MKDIDFSDKPARIKKSTLETTEENDPNKPSFLANMIFTFNAICLGLSTAYLLATNSAMKRRIMRVYLMQPATAKYIGNYQTLKTYNACQVENFKGKLRVVAIDRFNIKSHGKNETHRIRMNDRDLPYFIMLYAANIRHIPILWACL